MEEALKLGLVKEKVYIVNSSSYSTQNFDLSNTVMVSHLCV